MTENTDVQRFMLLAAARTGSNLLLSLLSAHSSIKTYGELFNLDSLPRDSLLEALEDPVMYLRRRVYKAHRPDIAAVGFKMFHDHLTQHYFRKPIDPSQAAEGLQEKFRQFSAFLESNYEWPTLQKRFRAAWDFLIDERSLAVIHLKRRNMLNTLISLKTAFMTRQWWSLTSGTQPTTTVHLDPEECRRYFDGLDASAAEADQAFSEHRRLEILYEDLVEHQHETLQRVFDFLRVPYQPVSTRMRKQITAPPSEIVDNFSQLKECFQNTRWAIFFE
jgi:LPS sulfotransferase NodH